MLSCERLHELTQGAFDLTSGPLSKAWGFWRREGRLPKAEEIAAALPLVSQKLVLLDHAKQGVSFANAGVEINFNAVGKGYALDRAAEVLVARGVGDFLIHGGRSSVLARGGDRSGGDGWRIAVPHPLSAERSLGEITLRDEALGTTGAGVQFFEVQGKRFGHVIDPRTGWPAEGVLLSTVVAPTAAEADALSTALYVLGPGGAAELCAEQPSIAAVLVCPRAGGGEEVDVHAFNLDAARWAPAAL